MQIKEISHFLSNAKYINYLDKTNASAIIIDNSLTIPKKMQTYFNKSS